MKRNKNFYFIFIIIFNFTVLIFSQGTSSVQKTRTSKQHFRNKEYADNEKRQEFTDNFLKYNNKNFGNYFYGVDLIYLNPNLDFDKNMWDKIVKSDYGKKKSIDSGFIPEINIGDKSTISISGRKSIGFQITNKIYPNRKPGISLDLPESTTDFSIDQEMQIRVEGNVLERFYIDIDYDDTTEWDSKKNIKLSYLGTEDDIIQEVVLGDINLSLPRTKFISFNKKLFGVKSVLEIGPASYYAILSKEEGETSSASFFGESKLTTNLIPSSNYEKKYYNLKNVIENDQFPIKNVNVYYDDKNKYSNNENTEEVDIIINGEERKFYLDKLRNIDDYLIKTEDNSIIEFNNEYDDGYLLITYEDANGILHNFSNFSEEQIIFEVENRFSEARMKDKYFLGNDGLSIEETTINIYDSANNEKIEIDNNLYYYTYILGIDEDNDGTVDSKFINYEDGLLEFKYKINGAYYINKKPFNFSKYIELGTVQVAELPDHLENIYNEVGEDKFLDLINTIDNSEIYNDYTNPRIYFNIYVKYFSPQKSYNLEHIDIIQNSENVIVDGIQLVKNQDYTIDYNMGQIKFLNQDIISSDSEIEIDYEYRPVFASKSKTLFGNRIEVDIYEDLFFGATYIRDWMPEQNLNRAPSFGDETKSHSVYGVNLNYNWKFNDFEGSIKAEIAQSTINPNTYGEVILEDMENSKIQSTISLSRTQWNIASPPDGFFNSNRYTSYLSVLDMFENEYIDLDEIDSNYGDTTKNILKINSLPQDPNEFFSYVQNISTRGIDLSNYEKIVFWYKLDGGNGDINIDLGIINEDSDLDGIFDTEDTNNNNNLDINEDVGFDFNINGDIIKIGANNNLLDDEDLDGDGVLRTNEEAISYNIPLTGDNDWHKVSINLNNYTSGIFDALDLVKHIRLWGENFSGGSLEIGKIDLIGTSWEVSNINPSSNIFDIKTVSNYTDPDYIPLHDYTIDESDRVVEDISLVMDFDMSDFSEGTNNAYCKKNYVKSRDFTLYNKIDFAYFVKEADSATFDLFVRLATNENNYYEITKEIDSSSVSEWRYITLSDLKNINNNSDIIKIGEQADIRNIKYVYFGVKGDETRGAYSGKIYVNDIKLYDSNKQEGRAKYLSTEFNYKNYVSMNYNIESKDGKFALIGRNPDNSTNFTQRLNTSFNFGKMFLKNKKIDLSTSFNFVNSLSENSYNVVDNNNFSNFGKNISNQYNITTKISKENWPVIQYKYDYKKNEEEGTFSPFYDENILNFVSFNYSISNKNNFYNYFLPENIIFQTSEKLDRRYYSRVDDKNKNDSVKIDDWVLNLGWEWIDNFETEWKYNLTEKWDLKVNEFKYSESYYNLDNSFDKRFTKYINIYLRYSSKFVDTWNSDKIANTNYYASDYDFNRDYSGKISLYLYDFFDKTKFFTDKFNLNLEYKSGKTINYDDVVNDYSWTIILGDPNAFVKNITPDLAIDRHEYSFSYRTTFLGFLKTNLKYDYESQNTEYKTANSRKNERYEWPNIDISLTNINEIPVLNLLKDYIVYQNIRFNYNKIISKTKHVNSKRKTITVDPSFSWNIRWKKEIQTYLSINRTVKEYYNYENSPSLENGLTARFNIDYEFRTSKIIDLFITKKTKESSSIFSLGYEFYYDEKWYSSNTENDKLRIKNKISAKYSLGNQFNFSGNFMYNIYRSDKIINSYNEFGIGVSFEIIF